MRSSEVLAGGVGDRRRRRVVSRAPHTRTLFAPLQMVPCVTNSAVLGVTQ